MCEVSFREISYLSSDGKTRVKGYFWAPVTGTPRAVIQLSHGMCEYVQRYDAWARRFAAAGFVFCGNDHLGHGNTAPDEDELGFTAVRGGADYLVEDVHTMTRHAMAEYPDVPVVLYGHSMGSFVARLYLTRYGDELAGAILSGTAGPGQPTGVALRLARSIEKSKGAHHRSRLLTSLAFGAYNKKFKKEEDVKSWLTRDKDVRERYIADPFCRFVFTAAGYETLFCLLGAVSDKKWADGVPKTLPILLIAGEMDPVGSYGRGVRAVHERLLRAGCDARIRLYEGGRHEMHNEWNKDEVFSDLVAYLEEILT